VEVRRLLADTSAYSAFLRGHPGMKSLLQKADEIVLTPVVLGELHAGFRWGRHRKKNEDELGRFLASPRVSVATLDEETSEYYAAIVHSLRAAGTPIPTNDIWIAASAMQHGLTVATTDSHFDKVPQVLSEILSVWPARARSGTQAACLRR
jgi:predicted nucleic acid-binding protein